MKYFYSAETGGFYIDTLHGSSIPADAVQISADEHAALMAGQGEGKSITVGTDGRPTLKAPKRPGVAQTRTSKLRQVNAAYQAAVDALLADYPQAETATFIKQTTEAETFDATGDPGDAPMLSIIAEHRGIELAALSAKVLEKSASYTTAIATLTGKRQHLEDQLAAATTLKAIDAITW